MSEVLPESPGQSGLVMRCLLGIAILAAAAAVAWGLAVPMDQPWLAAFVLTAAIGWGLYRLAHVNTKGLVLGCLAVVALSTATWARVPEDVGGVRVLCGLAGLVLIVASSIVFVVAAAKLRARRGRNCACASLASFILIAWIIIGVNISRHTRNQEAIKNTTDTLLALHKLGAEVESIRARLGRLPKDEAELVAFRGKPMPTFCRQYQIKYYRVNDDRYDLHCTLASFWGYGWDLFGWIVLYHSPNSPRRIQVELF